MNIYISTMLSDMGRLLRNTRGVTSIEYAIIASSIAMVIVGSVEMIGDDLTNTFSSIADGFSPADLNNMDTAAGGDGGGDDSCGDGNCFGWD